MIDMKNMRRQGKYIVRKMVNLLNGGGGFIMVGCKALECVAKRKEKIMNKTDEFFFNNVHFVVG